MDYSVTTIDPEKSVKQCERHIDRISNLALVFSWGLTKHKYDATQVLKRILVFLYELAGFTCTENGLSSSETSLYTSKLKIVEINIMQILNSIM